MLELGANTHPKPESFAELTESELYKLTTRVEINGNNAKFYAEEGHIQVQYGLIPEGTLLYESNCEANNFIAAILADKWHWSGWLKDDMRYSNTAWFGTNIIWDYWLEQSLGTNFTKVDSGDGWIEYLAMPSGYVVELTYSDGHNLEDAYRKLEDESIMYEYLNNFWELAQEKQYSVTIYHFSDKPNDGQTLQHIIMWEEHEPKLNELTVTKEWLDGGNTDKRSEIEVQLYTVKNGVETLVEGKTLKLNESNNWTGKFEGLPQKDAENEMIYYTVKEMNCPEGYISQISEQVEGTVGSNSSTYTIVNTLLTDIKVSKQWDDGENIDEMRPTSIQVTLCANGVPTSRTETLDESNNWTYTFKELNKYDENNKEIKYTIKEQTVDGYTTTYNQNKDANGNTNITITNKHIPNYDGYIEITGKVWEDVPNGKANEINGIIDDDEKGLGGIKVILKDAKGNQFDATSIATTNADGTYTIKVNYDNSKNVYKLYEDVATVTTKLNTAYVEFEYDGLQYTTVKTNVKQDKAGNEVTPDRQSKAKEDEARRNNLDNKYSTITSKTETMDKLTELDKNVIATTQKVITSFTNYEKIEGNTGTRKENVIIKYCNGDGKTYIRTNPKGAWNNILTNERTCQNCTSTGHEMNRYDVQVQVIKNVNLGLQKREQPDISIESNIGKVEVNANGQKYTYIYNAVVTDETNTEIKAQFQNKQSYTYRRPVNPADIAYLQETSDEKALSVYVTYEVTATNESTTLVTTINNIINSFDNRYTLESATIDGKEVTRNQSSIYKQTDFNEVTLSDLNIKINPKETSSKIMLRYKIDTEAIKGLLNEDATLSNAVEIESYTTSYGENTVYAEQQKGGRTGKPYAGYDKDAHPGNAAIKVQEVDYTYTYTDSNGNKQTKTYVKEKVLKSTENLVDYQLEDGTIVKMPEDDTDIAPSFLLCKDDQTKTLSGTVFEDTDVTDNRERVGDGKYDASTEKNVQNVKVELYNVDGTLAQLYKNPLTTEKTDAVVYTDANGNYAFEGIVTGKEYYVKFTYGDDTSVLTNGATTIAGIQTNARNYKSTIITNDIVKGIMNKKYEDFTAEDKLWHMRIEDNYSVAVDNMVERLAIEDLQYNNFNDVLNMTSYSKPFTVQVEFDMALEGEVKDTAGNIGISNNMSKLDFGIIERPREDLFVEKTITSFKVTLANGQKLTEGDLTKDLNVPYAKTMGFMQNITSGKAARKASEKQVLVELDAELIQGAKLEVQYAVKVTNNNEIDYYYGVKEDYTNIEGWDTLKDYDKYIATSDKAKYYYYGDNNGLDIIKATIGFVDYLNEDLVYKEGMDSWEEIAPAEIYNVDKKLISDATYNAINSSKYKVFKTTVELGNGETEEISTSSAIMSANKVLANKDNNVFDNNAEIISIDGRTARTIQEVDGKVEKKTYKPGNYVPSLEGRKENTDTSKEIAGLHEQDDDRVRIIITPPTGTTTYVTYVVIALIGLIVIAIGIKFIKKKVLIK